MDIYDEIIRECKKQGHTHIPKKKEIRKVKQARKLLKAIKNDKYIHYEYKYPNIISVPSYSSDPDSFEITLGIKELIFTGNWSIWTGRKFIRLY